MSAMTLRVLFDTSADAIAARAQAWLNAAEQIDHATDEFINTTRDLAHVWPMGTAADAAHQKSLDLRNEISNAYQPCRTIGTALREHADTVRALQGMLHDITAEAVQAGFQVDIDNGTVSAPQHMYTEAGAGAYTIAQHCDAFMWQLDGLRRQAAERDEHTRSVIAANTPNDTRGFGVAGSPLIPPDALITAKGLPPADVNSWWTSLTPEQQDQLIHDYPDLVGGIDGIPATDRDTANRLVLGHDIRDLTERRDAVDARRNYLESMADQGTPQRGLPGLLEHHELALRRTRPPQERTGSHRQHAWRCRCPP